MSIEVYPDHTLDELEAMPTLAQGQADDLKIERKDGSGRAYERIWLSRCSTIEDGEPCDNKVTVERKNYRGNWYDHAIYEAR